MLTRPEVESYEVAQCRFAIQAAGLSAVTDGTNPDLVAPMVKALGWFGVVPADRRNPADADFAKLGGAVEQQYLDLLEIFVQELGHQSALMKPDSQEWPNYKITWGQAARQIGYRIRDLWNDYNAKYQAAGGPRAGAMLSRNRNLIEPRGTH